MVGSAPIVFSQLSAIRAGCIYPAQHSRFILKSDGNEMARGSKKKYTRKQKRKASKIERGYKKRGVSSKEAERRAWATVNKSDRGGRKKGGGGRGKKRSKRSSRKGARKAARTRKVKGVISDAKKLVKSLVPG